MDNGVECTICIAMLAMPLGTILFVMFRKGASVRPRQSGFFAVMAASAVACLALRLDEAHAFALHTTLWHYVPTVLFAALGAWLGKYCLKW